MSPGQCTSKTKELKTDPIVVVVVATLVTSPPLMSALIGCSSFDVIATRLDIQHTRQSSAAAQTGVFEVFPLNNAVVA